MKHPLYRCGQCGRRFFKSMMVLGVCRECLRVLRAQQELDEEAYAAAERAA